MSPIEAAWTSVRDRWNVSLDDFAERVREWEVHPVQVNGQCVGAVLVKGPHIHACIADCYGRWMGKAQLRLVNNVIEKNGYAETSATTKAGLEFVRRLGFKPHGNVFRRYEQWALKQH